MNFREEVIHYAWKSKMFAAERLLTVSGKPIEILAFGNHNLHSGPDFDQAKIRIDKTIWAGSVEIHIRSSDWYLHNHHIDKAYNNVILHVVFEHDREVVLHDNSVLETLVIKNFIPPKLIQDYDALISNLNWIPCEKMINRVDVIYQKAWLSRVVIEKLESKFDQINQLLAENKGSWEDAFYVMLARNFGFKVNSEPFEMLAKSLPQQILSKYKNSPMQIEALVFGQAGFLDEKFSETYPRMLKTEYEFLKQKHGLKAVDRFLWKFMRMRPTNFPTLRLAQFAALIVKSSHLFSSILDIDQINDMINLFKELPINRYWKNHYRFEQETSPFSSQLGKSSLNIILINTIVPFLFCYGKYFGKDQLVTKALRILENLPSENNSVVNAFKKLGVEITSAETTQALLHLKNNYCNQKKCLNCGIGIKLIGV